MASNNSSSSGIGFTSLLQLLFITLKLTGAITWSWFWVLSPILISIALAIIIIAAFIIVALNKRR